MPKIKNESYKKFSSQGIIDIMKPEEFQDRLSKIKLSHHADRRDQWINFLTLLYWTGRRPAEILSLKPESFDKKGGFISILFETFKGGRASVLYFSIRRIPEINSVYNFAKKNMPGMYIFFKLISPRRTKVKYKIKGSEEVKVKIYSRPTKNITYLVTKWFGVPPYFFRHNRFSDMSMKGASEKQIQHNKGAKDLRSVQVYVHLSAKVAKETSKFIF